MKIISNAYSVNKKPNIGKLKRSLSINATQQFDYKDQIKEMFTKNIKYMQEQEKHSTSNIQKDFKKTLNRFKKQQEIEQKLFLMNKDLRFNNSKITNKEFQTLVDTENQYLDIISTYQMESNERKKQYLEQPIENAGITQLTEPAVTLTNNQSS